jgi:GPH family glycoside/pentoside/hexuronide:cation symporter
MDIKKLENPGYMYIVYFLGRLSFTMLTCCELYYFSAFMTDSAKLATALVAIILSVTSTVDFIVSFFLGAIVEVVRLPWGKYRSWLFVAPPVVTVTHMLMFSKVSNNETVSAIIIVIGFIVSHLFWSLGEVATYGLPLVMTEDPDQKTQLSLWGGRGSMANTLLFGVIAVPLITLFKNATGSSILGYCLFGLFLCILYWIGFWWLAFSTKGCETNVVATPGKKHENTLVPAIKSTLTNPNLLVMVIGIAATYCHLILQSSTMYYFFAYSLGNGMMAAMGVFVSLVSAFRLGGSFIVPLFLKVFKGNKRTVYILGFALVAVFDFLAYILHLAPIPMLALILAGNFFGNSACLGLQMGLCMDCAVYSEYKSGKDVKGFVMSMINLSVKLGITVKSYILSSVLVAIGYSVTAADTSAYAGNFSFVFLMIPVIICIVAIIANLLGYHLNETKVAQMQTAINEKKLVV